MAWSLNRWGNENKLAPAHQDIRTSGQRRILPQTGCWRSWGRQPRGRRPTSRAQTQTFWGSGRKAWCRSQGRRCFPSACIPCFKREHSVREGGGGSEGLCFAFRRRLTKWTQCARCEMSFLKWDLSAQTVYFSVPLYHYPHFNSHRLFRALVSNLPVRVRPNLFNNGLSALQEHVWVGHIEEVVLHIDRRGWVLPWLKNLARLCQSDFLSTKRKTWQSEIEKLWQTSDCEPLFSPLNRAMCCNKKL